MFSTAGQRNGSPRAQIRHLPHDPIGDAATACPSLHPDTSEPSATIRPLNSCPRICPGAQFPFCTECTSDPHSPHASTATMTSAGPGRGVGHVADRGPGLFIHIQNGPHWLPASR